MAIGMSDEIGDPDAMSFAARFYTAIADGQSVRSAYEAARIQMEKRSAHPELRAADAITSFAGSMPFVYVHVVSAVVARS